MRKVEKYQGVVEEKERFVALFLLFCCFTWNNKKVKSFGNYRGKVSLAS
ncbi:hypothetical protein BTH41_03014 [Bacillus mycoides]|nr:hypothetical protein BTH41_03014 [Bacillus mycoides]